MKSSDFEVGEMVSVSMPKGSQKELHISVKVIEKGEDGVVLLQKENGRRFFTNAHRLTKVHQ